MSTPRERLAELRDAAERIPLGDPDARKVRGLVVDLCDVLLGREPQHPDVTASGARLPPIAPERLGVTSVVSAPVPRALAAPAGAARDVAAPDASAGDPAGDDWMAAAEADVSKIEREGRPKAPSKPEARESTPNGGH